jgi:hypothetical protein
MTGTTAFLALDVLLVVLIGRSMWHAGSYWRAKRRQLARIEEKVVRDVHGLTIGVLAAAVAQRLRANGGTRVG